MPTVKLNAKTINAIVPPTAGEMFYFDDALTGFGLRLRIGAHGKLLRSWICQYKRAGGTRRMTLDAGGALTADQARAKAKAILAAVALGHDPQAEKADRRDKDRNVLRALIVDYLDAKKVKVRPRTLSAVTDYLNNPRFFGPLHNMPVDQITRRDVAGCITRIKKSGPAMAGAARNTLSAFFSWAMGEGLAESNPVIGTNRPETNGARSRVLSDIELAAIWRGCDDGSEHSTIVKLLILTGCRRAEVGDMAWREIDFDKGIWRIPPERSKNGRQHILPIMPAMRSILESVPRMATRDQLFGERSVHGFSRWHCKADLDARLDGPVPAWTLHDLRRTFSTRLNDLGVSPWVVEALLNHTRHGVERTYNLSRYQNDARAALAVWESHIAKLVKGGASPGREVSGRRVTGVVPLTTARNDLYERHTAVPSKRTKAPKSKAQ
jgi:integrase